ncbi:hypothetical protein GOP47_0001812 [Adiantum capillus-veneris]|uniref:DYW domain-containing protein n=1 Tax=Adiantum capillus-veneris TaxID=13818 RepID=A0A9D4V9N5_ADICA|nr:hypothetical protein GOP47_0001812 [Adiantum capillus-veneris]
MASVIQNPFLLRGHKTREADGGDRLPHFASPHSKDAMHAENSWNWSSLQALESNHVTSVVLSDRHRVAWKNSASISVEELRKTCIHGNLGQAIQQVSHLAQEGVYIPEDSILQLILRCINERDLASGCKSLRIQLDIVQCGLDTEVFVGSTLIDMYAKHIHATLVEGGFDLDTCVSNALMDMYLGCNHLQDAYKVFNKISNRDVISWSTLMAGSAELEDGEVVLQHYMAMLDEGIKPSVVTFISLLRACSSIAALEHGQYFHAQSVLSGFDLDVYISSALIHMYSSCGCLKEAHIVFHRLNEYDAGVWSAMITCYAQNNNYQEAFLYFESMQRSGLKLDSVTFLCILSACNRAGLVQEGRLHLMAMRDRHHLFPSLEHLNCMVDLLGNANLLNEARDLLETIPFWPNIVGWISLLSSCKRHINVDIGRQCFDYIVTLDKRNVASYVLMSNIYFSCGMTKYGQAIDELRMIANGWKKPGKAFIEVNKEIYSFVVGDRDCPESEAIYNNLKRLKTQMKMEESKVLVGSELKGISVEAEEDGLCGHCEKLALSFGLLHTPRGTTIRISKNLRMCAVCHMDTQFISKAEKREIIIVDSCLVHHFQDGLCQCNMYGVTYGGEI